MKILVIGGSGSGKSEYAESLAVKLAKKTYKLYYIATMEPYDKEMYKKIQRHQDMRSEKGFQTIEQYRNLQEIEAEENAVILLECMSNLLANELYPKSEENVCDKILKAVKKISQKSKALIIVSNDIFSSGEIYEEETRKYQRYLGKINKEIAKEFDYMIEVYYKIPIFWKGEEL